MPTELTGKFNPKWFSTGRQRRGAWTHALHTHADEINNDGNGPTNGRARARGALEQPLRPGGARAGPAPTAGNPRVGYGTRGRRLSEATDTGKS